MGGGGGGGGSVGEKCIHNQKEMKGVVNVIYGIVLGGDQRRL